MKMGKFFLCGGIVVFLTALFGITAADSNQSKDTFPPAAQPESQTVLNPDLDPETETKTSQKIMQQLLSLIGVSDSTKETETKVVVSSSPAPNFSDVKETDWFYREVMWAVGENITKGVTESQFDPFDSCKNAQVLTFLWRTYGMPEAAIPNPFTDVAPDSYFYQPALWAYEQGLVSGSSLSPDTDCTRAMVVEYLWKANNAPATAPTAQFSDVPASAAFSQAVTWAVDSGITAGVDQSVFSPNEVCTRAQIVTFLYRNFIYANAENGAVTLSSGTSYSGRMINGVPYGNGILIIPEVGYYDGEFYNGERSGTGSFFWDSGETYNGSWRDDKISGDGIFTLNSGAVLKGSFLDGSMSSGTCTLTQDDGTIEVSITNGKVQSPAAIKLSMSDGSTYAGSISDGKLNGSCTITYGNGDKFVGNVTDNLKAGIGTYTWKNGAWYEGDWTDDAMSGSGTYYYTDRAAGERVSGQFVNNAPNGECNYFSADNKQYKTTWKNGRCTNITRR